MLLTFIFSSPLHAVLRRHLALGNLSSLKRWLLAEVSSASFCFLFFFLLPLLLLVFVLSVFVVVVVVVVVFVVVVVVVVLVIAVVTHLPMVLKQTPRPQILGPPSRHSFTSTQTGTGLPGWFLKPLSQEHR